MFGCPRKCTRRIHRRASAVRPRQRGGERAAGEDRDHRAAVFPAATPVTPPAGAGASAANRMQRIIHHALLDINALPRRGYLSQANQEREAEKSFVAARRAHPAIESAINGLEHRGLDRVRSHGADGFARTVALSVLAANLAS